MATGSVASGPDRARHRGGVVTATIDYHAILASTVAAFRPNTAKARRAAYDHARKVVQERLRAARPQLSKHLVKLEQLALELAINKVESEARWRVLTDAVQLAACVAAWAVETSGMLRAALWRRRRQLLRALAPFGLALMFACGAVAYWFVAAGSSNRVVARSSPPAPISRAPSDAVRAVHADATGAVAQERFAALDRVGATHVLSGCDAATDPIARITCAQAGIDASERGTEAHGAGGLPPWIAAYGEFQEAAAPSRAAREAPASSLPAGGSGSGKARELVESGKRWAKKNDLDRAIRDFTEAIRIDPLFADAYLSRGQSLFKLGNVARAIADFNECIRLEPRNAFAARSRGMALLYSSDEGLALADLTRAIQLAEAESARMSALDLFYTRRSRAALYDKKQLYEREIQDLTAMIDAYWKDPLLAEALRINYRETGAASLMASIYRLRSGVHQRMGKHDLAIADLSFALQLDSQRAFAILLERARIQEALGRRDQAIADLQRALEINPASQEAKNGLVRLKGQAS